MKAVRLIPLVVCLAFTVTLNAQELVLNGSFDIAKGKLKKLAGIEMAAGWNSPTMAKADLFSNQAEEGPVSALKNPYGSQEPRKSDNYAGIRVYSANDREPRTYLQTALSEPMREGKKYCVKYHLSFADLSRFSTPEVRAYFSSVSVEKDDMSILGYPAQIPDTGNAIIDDMQGWTAVCGIYTAKGGEQHLIIGNFRGTKETRTGKVRKPKGEVRPQLQHGYYYIDDISIAPITVAAECKCGAAAGTFSTGFIFGRDRIEGTDLSTAQKIDRQIFYFQRFQSGIHSSMDPFVAELVELMNTDPKIKIQLTGHGDELEKERYKDREDQDQLGRERANAVKQALIDAGIDGDRITVSGKSDEDLVDPSGSEIGMSKNRRVEVELVK